METTVWDSNSQLNKQSFEQRLEVIADRVALSGKPNSKSSVGGQTFKLGHKRVDGAGHPRASVSHQHLTTIGHETILCRFLDFLPQGP